MSQCIYESTINELCTDQFFISWSVYQYNIYNLITYVQCVLHKNYFIEFNFLNYIFNIKKTNFI
jgi:hypothetical protein